MVEKIEDALDLGRFIEYRHSWDYTSDLGTVREELDGLVEQGEAERAVPLFELFLSGCYEKAEEIDDSGGNLGTFFEELFCSWIRARQAAGEEAEETVDGIMNWLKTDEYGFCHRIEAQIAEALDRRGCAAFRSRLESELADALMPFEGEPAPRWSECPYEVRQLADGLKRIYLATKALTAYLALCERIEPTPKDCENLAKLCRTKRQPQEALMWVERGIKAEKEGRWGNESAWGLRALREELLKKLGRSGEALASAWDRFEAVPNDLTYKELMKYVPKGEKAEWRAKALAAAKVGDLGGFMEVCVSLKEWDLLAERVHATTDESIERLSHYCTEPAAKRLTKKRPLAAAKLYRALGMRIVEGKKSKYYNVAVDHLRTARDLYVKHGQAEQWDAVVAAIRERHSRKYSFIGDFEKLVSRQESKPSSFESRMRTRWQKQAGR